MSSNSYTSSNSDKHKERNKLQEKKEDITNKYTKQYLDNIRETEKIHPIKQQIRIQTLLQHFGTHYGYLD